MCVCVCRSALCNTHLPWRKMNCCLSVSYSYYNPGKNPRHPPALLWAPCPFLAPPPSRRRWMVLKSARKIKEHHSHPAFPPWLLRVGIRPVELLYDSIVHAFWQVTRTHTERLEADAVRNPLPRFWRSFPFSRQCLWCRGWERAVGERGYRIKERKCRFDR